MMVEDPQNREGMYNPNVLLNTLKQYGTSEQFPEEEEEESKERFGGSGYRLGATPGGGSSGEVPSSHLDNNTNNKSKLVTRVLTLYQDGFTVDDGPLRRYDDPKNKPFLDDVNRGLAPRELEASARGQVLDIKVVDKKDEEYKEPPRVLKPFTGTGHTLSGDVPRSGGVSTNRVSSNNNNSRSGGKVFVVDLNAPTTTVRIILHDGNKIVQKFNLSHTVGDIRTFLDSRGYSGMRYRLQTTVPVTILGDDNQTIEQAGLKQAVIVQNLI